jgi:hypothetical protein
MTPDEDNPTFFIFDDEYYYKVKSWYINCELYDFVLDELEEELEEIKAEKSRSNVNSITAKTFNLVEKDRLQWFDDSFKLYDEHGVELPLMELKNTTTEQRNAFVEVYSGRIDNADTKGGRFNMMSMYFTNDTKPVDIVIVSSNSFFVEFNRRWDDFNPKQKANVILHDQILTKREMFLQPFVLGEVKFIVYDEFKNIVSKIDPKKVLKVVLEANKTQKEDTEDYHQRDNKVIHPGYDTSPITTTITSRTHGKRFPSQKAVMGGSAYSIAHALNLDPELKKLVSKQWHWLHLSAASFNPPEKHAHSQFFGNLVIGTLACNGHMIFVEDFITYILKNKLVPEVKLKVERTIAFPALTDEYSKCIVTELTYTVTIAKWNKEMKFQFYPFSIRPMSKNAYIFMKQACAIYAEMDKSTSSSSATSPTTTSSAASATSSSTSSTTTPPPPSTTTPLPPSTTTPHSSSAASAVSSSTSSTTTPPPPSISMHRKRKR